MLRYFATQRSGLSLGPGYLRLPARPGPWLRLLIGVLLVSSGQARAQADPTATTIIDTFEDNRYGWVVGDDASNSSRFEPGQGFHVKTNVTGDAYSFTAREWPLVDAGDFSVELLARVAGTGGLLMGYRAPDEAQSDYTVLQVRTARPAPDVQVWHHHHNRWDKLAELPWPAVASSPAAAHRYRVARQGNRLRYEFDGQLVHEQAYSGWPGSNHTVGLYLEGTGTELWATRLAVAPRPFIHVAPNLPAGLRRERLPDALSSSRTEKKPLVSADGHYLYFTRAMGPDASRPSTENADIFIAEHRADGTWTAPTKPGRPLNNEDNNTVESFTPDGQHVLIRNVYTPDGSFKSRGLSLSHRRADGQWLPPEPFFEGDFIANAGDYNDVSLDASGQVLIVSADTKKTPHNSDLYVIRRQPNGRWSKPRPLSAVLNTALDEQAPFLAADGKTLYFASDGHPGYGNYDIFVTTRLDDSWTNWSPPLNLGPAVNTPAYESFFSVPASGAFGYLVSTEPGAPELAFDLYQVSLPPSVRPTATLLVRGRVLDARTNAPVPAAEVSYELLPTGREAGQVPMAGAGSYQIVLPAGSEYGFRASAPGYISVNESVDLTTATQYAEVTQDLFLMPLTPPTEALAAKATALQVARAAVPRQLSGLTAPSPVVAAPEVEEHIALNNVFFVQGKPELLPASYPELSRLAQTLRDNPGLEIRLDGHTDNTGDAKDPRPNQLLSEQRTQAVQAYLVRQKIAAARLATRGYGGSRPVAPNDTEAHKAQNRRVEFVIVKR